MTRSDQGDEAVSPGEGLPFTAHFDHCAVAAPRIRDLLPLYADILGGRFINGGDNTRVGYRALQLAFADGSKIELMEPLSGSTFFDAFFASRGAGLHHVTFKVDDLDGALERLRAAGTPLTGLYRDDPSWQEVFIHPRDASGVLVQIAQAAPGAWTSPDEGQTIEAVLAGNGTRGTGEASP